MSSVFKKLTEGIVSRDVAQENKNLTTKWEKTGLLEGLNNNHERQSMASLLENQAKEILREANSMGAGAAVEGFASVAFPIVRRVFGGLLANDLVSVQPMSLPSGLIFFLDFTRNADSVADTDPLSPYDNNQSLHGGNRVAKGIATGLEMGDADVLHGSGLEVDTGFYNLSGVGTSNGRAEATVAANKWTVVCNSVLLSAGSGGILEKSGSPAVYTAAAKAAQKAIDYDPRILELSAEEKYASTPVYAAVIKLSNCQTASTFTSGDMKQFAQGMEGAFQMDNNLFCERRLTKCTYDANGLVDTIQLVLLGSSSGTSGSRDLRNAQTGDTVTATSKCSFAIRDNFTAASATGGVVGAATWALEDTAMPEIDIKVDSIAITAQTKKLKAKWTPELGQDLNSYHNLDAEVELTSVLSEQIALEIDKEILNDLLQGGTNTTRYWSKLPGQKAGTDGSTTAIDFTGNVSEWYETLVETVNDVSADIHRKTLRGGANFLVCGPEVANILEFTSGFRASVTHDSDRGTVGTYKNGSINKKWDLYVDPYFPRNSILVGRKGSSFLESGYVYAPYVPLQTTPTIFDPDTLTPRKGVMTRYGKKMVRPDMYGVVLVRDM